MDAHGGRFIARRLWLRNHFGTQRRNFIPLAQELHQQRSGVSWKWLFGPRRFPRVKCSTVCTRFCQRVYQLSEGLRTSSTKRLYGVAGAGK